MSVLPKRALPEPGLELVPAPACTPGREPEQIPLLRMLEVVRDRVEQVHAGQRALAEEVREMRRSLPQQRRPVSSKTEALHIRVTFSRRNGLCPCCQQNAVCTETNRLQGSEVDHWYTRYQNRVTQTWLVCGECNQNLNDSEFKAAARSAFEAYQQALRPFLAARQMALNL